MINLVLSGGGDAPDSKSLDEVFINLLNGKKILYIPLAWKGGDIEVVGFESAYVFSNGEKIEFKVGSKIC